MLLSRLVFGTSNTRRARAVASVLLLAACGEASDENDAATVGDSSGSSGDGSSTTMTSSTSSTSSGTGGEGCDLNAPFGPAVALGELNTSDDEETPRLTPDELTLLFARDKRLLQATRGDVSEPFGEPTPIPGFDAFAEGWAPWLSPDGLTLYFSLVGPGVDPSIFVARRSSTADDFGAPQSVGLDTGGLEWHPFSNPEQSELWFVTDATPSGTQIWRAPLNGDGTVGTPQSVPELAANALDWTPVISADGLEIFFARGTSGNYDIYSSRRPSVDSPFETPAPVAELVDEGLLARELPGWLSADRCRLYFSRGTPQDIFYTERQ
jgi:hypothetical protein